MNDTAHTGWTQFQQDQFEARIDQARGAYPVDMTDPFPPSSTHSTRLLSESEHLRQQVRLMRAKQHVHQAILDLQDCLGTDDLQLTLTTLRIELDIRTSQEAQRWH
jgi:hypothetical protein